MTQGLPPDPPAIIQSAQEQSTNAADALRESNNEQTKRSNDIEGGTVSSGAPTTSGP